MTDRVDLHEPYTDSVQQHEADMMGIYIFLATEAMLFGGLFAAAFVARVLHPEEAATASKHLHIWIGGANTVVLLTSSLVAALGVHAARLGAARRAALLLGLCSLLGIAFLGIKGFEYWTEYTEGMLPQVSMPTRFESPVEHQYMNIYFISTALHAFHLAVGVVLLGVLAWRLLTGRLRLPHHVVAIEVAGVYWGFVDVVWNFLYPVLYLIR